MVALVSLEQTKAALRIEHTDHDTTLLPLLIGAASEAVVRYLKTAADAFLDEAGEAADEQVPELVQQATILLVGYWYDPHEKLDEAFEFGQLPTPVRSLLYPLRMPTVA